MNQSKKFLAPAAALLGLTVLLSACAPAEENHADDDHQHSHEEASGSLLVSFDSGVYVVDQKTLEITGELSANLPGELEYSAQQLAVGPHGELFILASDGRIYVATHPETGEIDDSWQVVAPWALSDTVTPALFISGHDVYVADPVAKTLLRLDSHSGEILARVSFDHAPEGFSGLASGGGHDHGSEHGHDDHEHDDHGDDDHDSDYDHGDESHDH